MSVVPPELTTTPMSDFLKNLSNRSYKSLIEHQMKRISANDLQKAAFEVAHLLPEEFKSKIEDYITIVDFTFRTNYGFWEYFSCRDAVINIIELAVGHYNLNVPKEKIIEWCKNNDELSFQLFWISTLHFAHTCSRYREYRKLWGIRKGFFG